LLGKIRTLLEPGCPPMYSLQDAESVARESSARRRPGRPARRLGNAV
jgi:hypothetical protein